MQAVVLDRDPFKTVWESKGVSLTPFDIHLITIVVMTKCRDGRNMEAKSSVCLGLVTVYESITLLPLLVMEGITRLYSAGKYKWKYFPWKVSRRSHSS